MLPPTSMTEEEYVLRETEAEYKNEYRDGRVVAMSGASPVHSLITTNLIRELSLQLKGTPCRVLSSDTRIKVTAAHFYTYPDLSVVCAAPRFDSQDPSALLNPGLIVEVLSPSTEDYDRGQKFAFYRRLASLKEYVLVAWNTPYLERFVLWPDATWHRYRTEGLASSVDLASLPCSLALQEVYDKADLP